MGKETNGALLKDKLRVHLESRPLLVEPLYYDMQAENYPDSDRYYTEPKQYAQAFNEWVDVLVKIACRATGLEYEDDAGEA